ncbi:MAG TPA: hypothetical protein VKZ58_01645 [Longimicrobiales bacterium]|nr:hypothetical protein [Longimicrobiales bacterium]
MARQRGEEPDGPARHEAPTAGLPVDDAVNPAWVLSDADGGADIVAALEDAGYAARAAPDLPPGRRPEVGFLGRNLVTPPLVVVDLRGELSPADVRRVRAEGRFPVLAVADDASTARAAVQAGANETVTTADLGRTMPAIVNLLLRMATLW